MILARGLRPKKVDIDKPNWYTKGQLRRWWRRTIRRQTRKETDAVD